MPLRPNTPFADGDAFTPDLAYQAFNSPVFDDLPQYLGHRMKIQDVELSDASGQIKDRVGFLESSLKVVQEGTTGLTVRYLSGRVTLPNNTTLVIASGLLAVTDNAVTFIFIDQLGAPRAASRLPAICVPLAKVTAVNTQISQIEDMRHPNQKTIAPAPNAIKVFGGSVTGDFVAPANTVFKNGYHYCRDFTVPAGVNLVVQGFARIFCSGNVNIAGTITVQAMTPGCPLQAWNLTNSGSVGLIGGTGIGTHGRNIIPWAAQPYGSGGGSGLIQCWGAAQGWGYTGAGGDGGGGVWIEASGNVVVTGTIVADGSAGGQGGNASNMAPGGLNSTLPSIMTAGGGGGSGGLVYLSALGTISISGGLYARGGNGGNGRTLTKDNSRIAAFGGAGGGGGYIVLSAPAINTSGSILNVNGGTTGSPLVNDLNGAATWFTQPSPGVFRIDTAVAYLLGGNGGSYASICKHPLITTQTEASSLVTYFTNQTADPGTVLLQTFSPIGS